jgi:hypothetical protein
VWERSQKDSLLPMGYRTVNRPHSMIPRGLCCGGAECRAPMSAASWSWPGQLAEALECPPLPGDPPLVVLHRWWAGSAGPVLGAAAAGRGEEQRAQESLAAAHGRAAGGAPVGAGEWREVLEPALAELFRWAYPYDEACAAAARAAEPVALANGFTAEAARAYAGDYARLNTDAAVLVSAAANATATAAALAAAYADADPGAVARAHPYVLVRSVLAVAPQARDRLIAGLRAAVRP